YRVGIDKSGEGGGVAELPEQSQLDLPKLPELGPTRGSRVGAERAAREDGNPRGIRDLSRRGAERRRERSARERQYALEPDARRRSADGRLEVRARISSGSTRFRGGCDGGVAAAGPVSAPAGFVCGDVGAHGSTRTARAVLVHRIVSGFA